MINFIKRLFKRKPVYIRELLLFVNGAIVVTKYELIVNGLYVFVDTTDTKQAIKNLTGLRGKKKTVSHDYGICRHSQYLTRYIKI